MLVFLSMCSLVLGYPGMYSSCQPEIGEHIMGDTVRPRDAATDEGCKLQLRKVPEPTPGYKGPTPSPTRVKPIAGKQHTFPFHEGELYEVVVKDVKGGAGYVSATHGMWLSGLEMPSHCDLTRAYMNYGAGNGHAGIRDSPQLTPKNFQWVGDDEEQVIITATCIADYVGPHIQTSITLVRQ